MKFQIAIDRNLFQSPRLLWLAVLLVSVLAAIAIARAAEPPGRATVKSSATASSNPAAQRPNIVYILCDDLGYGDVKCLNPEGKIATPHIDRLAAGGMIFTDAHACSSVCTPSRYGILTGRYNWRSSLERGVLEGFSPRLIETGRLTAPQLLKQHGYQTACIGKWHLGMNWPLKEGGPPTDEAAASAAPDPAKVDFARPIRGGPNSLGFDYFFGISASADMPPFVFIENDRCMRTPTVEKTFLRKGLADPRYEAIDVLPTITEKAVQYIAHHAADAKQGRPLFLYFPLTAPHTPILPSLEFQGKSGINAYADFVMQVDDTVGRVLDALDRTGLTDSTLVLFASDNGCSPLANFPQLAAKGHFPSYHFRGYKADIYDGGHRIPLVVRWPGNVRPGSHCDQLVSLDDFIATCADFLGDKLPENAGEDSVSLLPVLRGATTRRLHEALVYHSIDGSFSIQQGDWKLELCPGSGGWSFPRPGVDDASKLPQIQLYDLARDVGEKANVQEKHPEVVARLTKLLEKYVAEGRTTPGPPQKNSREVDIRKAGKAAEKPPKEPPPD